MADIDAQARELFLQVLDQEPEHIAPFLDDACHGNAELRQRVLILLNAHNEAGNFLSPSPPNEENVRAGNGPNLGKFAETTICTNLQPGISIGPYRLLEQIGEGGMGSVWVASQSQPIKRKVAIKLIKAGMDSRQVLARFEAERQALAMMDHPNIARVLDGGMTEQGRPFFAMEYVKGVPLTEYCDQAKLSVKERLELFLPICHAVQHAHQKGIIHRDLKPSNILVCLFDGKPVPKVIDFGLAKAMHRSLTDQSVFTAHGMMVGTPLYMSPEQAEQNNLDIDTRADVYALGVILYELLTGTTPLESAQMKEAAYVEILRLIKEVEPPKPSTRLSGSESLPSVAAQRNIDPKHLTRSIVGDLDWVVMKALEKERTRRYSTANGLAEDICRHLADEPVSAGPPSTSYRVKKFIRRNRAGVIAAAATTIALLLGVVGTTSGMIWALSEQRTAIDAREAERKAKRAAQASSKQANDEAKRARAAEQRIAETLKDVKTERDAKERARQEAERISEFLTSVFQSPNPERDGRDIKVVELLDNAIAKLDTELADLPEQRARLQTTLGQTYHALGLQRKAIPLVEKARDYYLRNFGIEDVRTLSAMNDLALYYNHNNQRVESLKINEESYAVSREVLGPQHPCTLKAMSHLAFLHTLNGRREETLKLREQAVKYYTDTFGEEHPETFSARDALISAHRELGQHRKATAWREELLPICSNTLGPADPITLRIRSNLASCYYRQRAKALELHEEQVAVCQEAFGDEHPHTIKAKLALATSYRRDERNDEARKLLEELLVTSRRVLGSQHAHTRMIIKQLISCCETAGLRERTLSLREEHTSNSMKRLALDDQENVRNLDYVSYSALELAAVLAWEQQRDTHVRLSRQLLDSAANFEYPPALERAAKIACLIPNTELISYQQAEQLVRRAVDQDQDNQEFRPWGRLTLGMALYRNGKFAEAEKVLAETKYVTGKIGGAASFFRAMALFQKGDKEAAQELFATAEEKMKPFPKEKEDPLEGIGPDYIIVWVAHREANMLINEQPGQ
ncbi:protein kinase domain-containing protein [Thalassoroseus pseudoceratinae]|uniref:protein kinase domain-containing protein n=1 Tax=Thalassoroseus pseudoceratinae TaxID=2713176 RepID=UPI0014203EF9|nr:tetratricopeptide repeat protein [Thalassoroseus pseudoceratinae]